MKNQLFNEVLLGKVLTFKHGNTIDIPEQFLDVEALPLKQVCAKLSVSLSDKIDDVCSILNMSKRSFIELALINAIEQFEQIADDFDIYAPHTREGASDA